MYASAGVDLNQYLYSHRTEPPNIIEQQTHTSNTRRFRQANVTQQDDNHKKYN